MLSKSTIEIIKKIRYLFLDVDGVLTDGTFVIDPNTEEYTEYKAFHSQDGYGMKMLLNHGIEIIIISGRKSRTVEIRMKQLGIDQVYLGIKNKLELFHEICRQKNIKPENCAYVGDDIPDLAVMELVGFRAIVANATKIMHKIADFQTTLPGGHGAVREVCDLILSYQE
jgi:3-deoxy-D-manno-octulosonate 8-phosphate phosphatase (KDO 8-P phosphatase)